MSNERNREDQALNALIAAAFRQVDCGDLTPEDLSKAEAALSREDLQALDNLGDDIVDKIVNDQFEPRTNSHKPEMLEAPEEELAGAMHRGEGEDELTDAAKEEMERKLRELDEDENDSDRN